jgi:hypothetical protein
MRNFTISVLLEVKSGIELAAEIVGTKRLSCDGLIVATPPVLLIESLLRRSISPDR